MGITNAPFAEPPGDWSRSGYTNKDGILYGPQKQQAPLPPPPPPQVIIQEPPKAEAFPLPLDHASIIYEDLYHLAFHDDLCYNKKKSSRGVKCGKSFMMRI
jgi:hypothetical protein